MLKLLAQEQFYAVPKTTRPTARTASLFSAFAAAVMSLGLTVAATGVSTTPAHAQLAPDAPSVLTPNGRAPLSFADIVEKVKPSVVSISVVSGGPTGDQTSRGLPKGFPKIPEDSPFYEFFKNLPKEFQGSPRRRPSQAQGSGFVISADGYVVTNNHVIDGANKIHVSFEGQEKLEAEMVGKDPRTDLALIKIKSDRKDFPALKFAGKPARVGDWALAVGNPFGLGGTVTAGIVSALGRDIGSGPYDFLQIDAAVNKGNSGGPTFNLSGEVIGVNTAIFSPSGGNVGIAFAVPSKTVTEVVEQLKSSGAVSRGWLGVKIQNVDDDTAAAIGLKDDKGALVSELTPNGPAAGAGLKVQDAIVEVDGSPIDDSRDLARKIAAYAPNSTVKVKVWRDNKAEEIPVKLGKFPGSAAEIAKLEEGKPITKAEPKEKSLAALGLTLSGNDVPGGKGLKVVKVDPDSDAAEKGLKAGDVLLEVSRAEVTSVTDVEESLKKATDLGRPAVMLLVKRAQGQRIVAVQLEKASDDEKKKN